MSQKVIERDIGDGVENFIIVSTECEFNGTRRYLVRERNLKRVRLFSDDEKGIASALSHITEPDLYTHHF